MLTNTSIHAAIGEAGPLDYSMIERAVDQGVGEDETLDWKGVNTGKSLNRTPATSSRRM